MTKTCNSCGQTKPVDAFHRRAASPDGRTASCKACVNDRQRRWREKTGYSPDRPPRRDEWDLVENVPDLYDRLVKHADVTGDGCWPWQAATTEDGYGVVTIHWHSYRPYRLMLQLHTGQPIPEGMPVDHVCRNRACIRPDHLRVVTAQVNSIENNVGPSAINAAKTHCKRGHPLSGDNLIRTSDGRACRTCQRAHERRWKARRRSVGGRP